MKKGLNSWTCLLCSKTHNTALNANGQENKFDDLLFMTKDFDPVMKSKSKAAIVDLDISGSMESHQPNVSDIT